MNKILVGNGGFPLYGDDLTFIDAYVRDAFKGIIHDIAAEFGGNLILGGCDFVKAGLGGTTTLSEGWCMINHEILYVPAQTLPGANGVTYSIYLSSANTQSRVFANGTTQQVWQIRTGQLNVTTPGSTGILLGSNANRIGNAIALLMQGVYAEEGSGSISMDNGWTKSGTVVPKLNKLFRDVTFQGEFGVGTLSQTALTKIAVLPSGYAPEQDIRVPVAAVSSSGATFGTVILLIKANGEVWAVNTVSTSWQTISVCCRYLAST